MAKVTPKVGKSVEKPEPTPDEKPEKTPRKEKAEFAVPEGGFLDWPKDHDGSKHKPLKRKDFKDESVWLFRRADELEKRSKSYRVEAENYKKLGSIKDRAKAKKLLKMQTEIAKLREQLKADGVDVDALAPKEETAKAETASA